MTHADLVKFAAAWLKNQKRCSIVASELVFGGWENPDVIGWNGWESWVIEAKISVSDFRADQKKSFRNLAGRGLGIRRYYIVPLDLRDKILPGLPDGWGLLTVKDGRGGVVVCKPSSTFANNWQYEILCLSSIIRRIAMRQPLRGVNVRCYTFQSESEPRAELHVEPAPAVDVKSE
jgi:hypothetical protein